MVGIPHPKVAFGDLAGKLDGGAEEISIPRRLLARLLDLYVSLWDFDEAWYLARNPDVADAVAAGKFVSGWDHFRSVGYWEGRWGNQPVVDTEWYVETYPDIAQAMLEGTVTSPTDHFEKFGYAEGRLPSKPEIHPRWYARRYMTTGNPELVGESEALEDFIRAGYGNLAFPAPPK